MSRQSKLGTAPVAQSGLWASFSVVDRPSFDQGIPASQMNMIMGPLRHLLVLVALSACTLSNAQLPTVDITMQRVDDGRYEVRLRPDLDFDGVFASIVFSVRWPAASTNTIMDFEPTESIIDLGMYPNMSGEVGTDGAYRYAIYAGFGFVSLSSAGQSWNAGTEVVLGHLLVANDQGDCILVNDDWTTLNFGTYYVSLNGVDRTGSIFSTATGVIEASTADHGTLFPNPSQDHAWYVPPVGLHGPIRIEVVDLQGKLVRSVSPDPRNVTAIYLDAAGIGPGQYAVHCITADRMHVAKWTVR